jgi:hypothetical protein
MMRERLLVDVALYRRCESFCQLATASQSHECPMQPANYRLDSSKIAQWTLSIIQTFSIKYNEYRAMKIMSSHQRM